MAREKESICQSGWNVSTSVLFQLKITCLFALFVVVVVVVVSGVYVVCMPLSSSSARATYFILQSLKLIIQVLCSIALWTCVWMRTLQAFLHNAVFTVPLQSIQFRA